MWCVVFFAGISGSSTADAEPVEDLHRSRPRKARPSFSVAITACRRCSPSSSPSILMIVGASSRFRSAPCSLPASFRVIGLAQWQPCMPMPSARLSDYPRETWRALLCATWIVVPALMTPGIIIGGKIFGWFTATESAPYAVLYAAVLSLFVYREMDLKGLYAALLDTGKPRRHRAVLSAPRAPSAGCSLLQDLEAILSGVSAGVWALRRPASSSPSCSWWLLPRRHSSDHHLRADPRAARQGGADGSGISP